MVLIVRCWSLVNLAVFCSYTRDRSCLIWIMCQTPFALECAAWFAVDIFLFPPLFPKGEGAFLRVFMGSCASLGSRQCPLILSHGDLCMPRINSTKLIDFQGRLELYRHELIGRGAVPFELGHICLILCHVNEEIQPPCRGTS